MHGHILRLLFGTGCILAFIGQSDGRECLKDNELERYPVNVYHCNDHVKTECCEENKQPTCCEPTSSRNLKEQVVLWGSVIGIVSIAVVLLLCWKRDSYICEGATLKDRAKALFRRGKGGENKFPDEEEVENIEIQTFKPPVIDRAPTPCTSSMDDNGLRIDRKLSPTARGRTSAMSCGKESSLMSNDYLGESSENEDGKSLVIERRSWTLSDKLPPIEGARRPPTADPFPSNSQMRPLNDIMS